MRIRSPSRTARFGLACSPFTSTLPPSQARLASERVLKRQATSSQMSRRRLSFTLRCSGFSVRVHVRRTPNLEPNLNTNRAPRTRKCEPSDKYLHLALRAKGFDEGLGLLVAVLALEELLHLRPHFFERHRARWLLLGHLDDVVAELRFDDVAHRARREAEGHVVERTNHLPLLEETEVTAIDGAARILGVLLGKRGEVLARLHILEHLIGFRLRLRLGGGIRLLGERDEDVARAHTFVQI